MDSKNLPQYNKELLKRAVEIGALSSEDYDKIVQLEGGEPISQKSNDPNLLSRAAKIGAIPDGDYNKVIQKEEVTDPNSLNSAAEMGAIPKGDYNKIIQGEDTGVEESEQSAIKNAKSDINAEIKAQKSNLKEAKAEIEAEAEAQQQNLKEAKSEIEAEAKSQQQNLKEAKAEIEAEAKSQQANVSEAKAEVEAEDKKQKKEPVKAEKKEAPPQPIDEIKDLISKTQNEEEKAVLLKQVAKFRDAIMGAGSGKIIKTDVAPYEELEKKAQKPLKSYLLEKELKDKKAKNDPNSSLSKLLRKSLSNMGMDMSGFETVPYSQLEKLYPKLVSSIYYKMMADAKKQDAATTREYKEMLRQSKEEQKKADAAKISDRQLIPINDADTAIANLNEVVRLAEGKYVGPLDARIPDVFIGGEEAAFRSISGRMTDAYRKLITGAGASAFELAKLEANLPKPTDTIEQFKAKAKVFGEELNRGKQIYLKNLKRQGKNISEFETQEIPQTEGTVQFSKKYKPGTVITLKNGNKYRIQGDGITGVKE